MKRKSFLELAKCAVILLILTAGVIGCDKTGQINDENFEVSQVSNVNFTPCKQSGAKSAEFSSKVDVMFTNEGVKITYNNFVVTCDFSDVNVTHTLVNGFLNITQQGAPNQANCICYTNVSYTLKGIYKNEVNLIFINGEQVYCYNDNEYLPTYNVTTLATGFYYPAGVALDSTGNLYVADEGTHSIRKITQSGVVTTFAGGGGSGTADGQGTAAKFCTPTGVAFDAKGNLFVAEYNNHRIRKITPAGMVTTVAGSVQGFADSVGSAAQFYNPMCIAVDAEGNIYVADTDNHRIRKVTQSGVVTTFAGSGIGGFVNGKGTAAQFNRPTGIAIDAAGNLYVADDWNDCIRKITRDGVVTTLAGNGTTGYTDGIGTEAQFNRPLDIAIDAENNLYVTDVYNHCIRKVTQSGVVSTIAGNGIGGSANGVGTAARFREPYGIDIDASGNIYVADFRNSIIRKIIKE